MLRATPKLTLRTNCVPLPVRVVQMQQRFYNEKPNTHTTQKTHSLDVQSAASKSGMAERQKSREAAESGAGGDTRKRDPKEEYPEAPGPIIGMQDERGHSMSSSVQQQLSWSSLGIVLGV